MKFNKDYLIVKKKPSAEKLGVKVYSTTFAATCSAC